MKLSELLNIISLYDKDKSGVPPLAESGCDIKCQLPSGEIVDIANAGIFGYSEDLILTVEKRKNVSDRRLGLHLTGRRRMY